jgi:hypothetical protein
VKPYISVGEYLYREEISALAIKRINIRKEAVLNSLKTTVAGNFL